MKISFLFSIIASTLISFNSIAQTNPGTDNLTHQWTFDDGTAKDAVTNNPVDGVLQGGATIENHALQLTTAGHHLSFSASELALNTYSEITQEIWFTPKANSNTGYTMLTYFGNRSGSMGYNYVMITTARGDDISRTSITDGTYDSQVGVDGTEYDDGQLHHMVSVINASKILFYIDGVLVGQTTNTKPLSTVGNTLAYLGRSGFTSDPTWLGTIHKFSIYNKSLTTDEVSYLYENGAETVPILSASAKTISFDEFIDLDEFTLSASNLTGDVTISAPAGVTVTPSSLSADVTSAQISVTYDGTTTVDGSIECVSENVSLSIPVNVYTNDCFVKAYPSVENLISDPYVHDISNFSGWGNRSINSDHDFVFCGSRSGKVTSSNNGSLDYTLNGQLMPNTNYLVKAKAYTIGGSFQLGILGWSAGSSDKVKSFNTNESWQDIEFTFTSGSSIGSEVRLFFNNYGLAGTTGYIDNWEMYAIPKIYPSTQNLTFITAGTETITVRGVSLESDITITPPQGISLSDSSISANTEGTELSVTYLGDREVNAYLYFTSDDIKDSILITASVAPRIETSVNKILVDELNNTSTFTVTAYNLTEDITIAAPEGIILSESTLPANAYDAEITLYYDGAEDASGLITLTSGTASASIDLQASKNDACFTPLFDSITNLITDPTCNSYIQDGWGDKGINSDPDFVYCGSRSGMVASNGSYDRDLTDVLKPNTDYRLKAKVYKVGLPGNKMGNVTYTLHMDSASNPEHYNLITEAMDSACYYFNLYTPFVKDVRVVYNTGVPTAQASYHGEMAFGSNTRYMWVGTAIHELAHYFGSGTTAIWQSKTSTGTWSGPVATALAMSIDGNDIHGDAQHYWPHGINQREEITNLGSVAAQVAALSNAVKVIKAMLVDDCDLPTFNSTVGVGVYGYDLTKSDLYHEVTTSKQWMDVDFTFTTGANLKSTHGVFFNSGAGYIDNWELYEINNTAVNPLKKDINELKAYFSGDALNVQFSLEKASNIIFTIYDVQGRQVSSSMNSFNKGQNASVLSNNLGGDFYLIKMQSGNSSITTKVVR